MYALNSKYVITSMRSLFRLDIHIIYSEFITQSSNYTVRDNRKVGLNVRLAVNSDVKEELHFDKEYCTKPGITTLMAFFGYFKWCQYLFHEKIPIYTIISTVLV